MLLTSSCRVCCFSSKHLKQHQNKPHGLFHVGAKVPFHLFAEDGDDLDIEFYCPILKIPAPRLPQFLGLEGFWI